MEALCFLVEEGSSSALEALPLDEEEAVFGVEQLGESLSVLVLLLGVGFAITAVEVAVLSVSSSSTACFFLEPPESRFFLLSFEPSEDPYATGMADPFRGFAGDNVGEGERVIVGEVMGGDFEPKLTLLLLAPTNDDPPFVLAVEVPLALEVAPVRLELEEEEAEVESPGSEECFEAELLRSSKSKMRLHTRVYCHASPLIRLKRTPIR